MISFFLVNASKISRRRALGRKPDCGEGAQVATNWSTVLPEAVTTESVAGWIFGGGVAAWGAIGLTWFDPTGPGFDRSLPKADPKLSVRAATVLWATP